MRDWSYALGFVPALLFLAGLRVMELQARARAVLALAMGLGAKPRWPRTGSTTRRYRVRNRPRLRHVVGPSSRSASRRRRVWLLRGDRVGFLVDAAILGFAGDGFALVENLLRRRTADPTPALWLVRGLGTAVMHGSTAAIVAILAGFEDRRAGALGRLTGTLGRLAGVPLAIAVHAAFNAVPFHPLLTTAALLVLMPLLLFAVYERSERATRSWLVTGFDSEVDMLEQIVGQGMHDTAVGRYLETLRRRFPPIVVADLLCLLRIHLELALRAKGMLIARAAGIDVRPDASVPRPRRLRYLRRTVGPTRFAILLLRRTGSRDLWYHDAQRSA